MSSDVHGFTHLHHSYRKARKGHRRDRRVMRFDFYLERELVKLSEEIEGKSYRPRPRRGFVVTEPKSRKIYESDFRDRVVHHALCSIIEPRFERRFLPVSYACRKGKGNLAALDRARRSLRSLQEKHGVVYGLKVDVRKYYDSISHETLLTLIGRDVPELELYRLADIIVRSHDPKHQGHGLPIGNLTSQVFANLYLHELDFHLVHRLGFKHCFRFMDDILVLHPDRERLQLLIEEINSFLAGIGLVLHPDKIWLRDMDQGLEMLGYRMTTRKRVVKAANIARIKRRLVRLCGLYARNPRTKEKYVRASLESWRGFACHGQTRSQLRHLWSWVGTLGHYRFQRLVASVFLNPRPPRNALTPPTRFGPSVST